MFRTNRPGLAFSLTMITLPEVWWGTILNPLKLHFNIILPDGLHNNKISIRVHVLAVIVRSGLARRTPCNPYIKGGAVVDHLVLGIAAGNAFEVKGEDGQLIVCRICCGCHRTAVGDIQISF